jgi:hypothetical protein
VVDGDDYGDGRAELWSQEVSPRARFLVWPVGVVRRRPEGWRLVYVDRRARGE